MTHIKLDSIIKEETRKRCKIFELDEKTERQFHTVNPELFHFLYDVPKVKFSVYFRIDNVMIEFVRKEEFAKDLLDQLWQAMQKSSRRLEICVLKADQAAFDKVIEEIRSRKIDNLLKQNPVLDRKVLGMFSNLSDASQMIVKGGITKEVVDRVRFSASHTVSNLLDSKSAIATLSKMITHDPTLYDHSASVALIAGAIALDCVDKRSATQEAELVTRCGLYHDVGKTCVPTAILNKPGKFTPDEFEVMKTHSSLGAEELQKVIDSGAPIDQIAVRVALEHHERMQGQGYPHGKKGREEDDHENGIHLYSRIVMIADVYSALLMRRVYKPSYEPQDAIKVMAEIAEKEFDMFLFSQFLSRVVDSLNTYQGRFQFKGSGRILLIGDDGKIREKKASS